MELNFRSLVHPCSPCSLGENAWKMNKYIVDVLRANTLKTVHWIRQQSETECNVVFLPSTNGSCSTATVLIIQFPSSRTNSSCKIVKLARKQTKKHKIETKTVWSVGTRCYHFHDITCSPVINNNNNNRSSTSRARQTETYKRQQKWSSWNAHNVVEK